MRKSFIFATMAAAALFAGCSSSDDLASNPGEEGIDTDAEKVAIEIGVASRGANMTMRGTGTVGDIAGQTTNIWNGEQINVLMYNINADGTPTFNFTGGNTPLYNGTALVTPLTIENTASGIAKEISSGDPYTDPTTAKYKVKYYPTTGRSDFWGYYLGGYGAVAANASAASDGGTLIEKDDVTIPYRSVKFEIDGTHDLMVAKAPTTANITGIDPTIFTAEALTTKQDAEITGDPTRAKANSYSATAARQGLQPDLVFKHVLSRLQFKVVAGNQKAADCGVKVTAIKVRSKKTGQLIVAYDYSKGAIETAKRVIWGDVLAEEDFDGDPAIAAGDVVTDNKYFPALALQERTGGDPYDRTMKALTPVALTWADATPGTGTDIKTVGEALLVAPQDSYYIIVEYTINSGSEAAWYNNPPSDLTPGPITPGTDPVAQPPLESKVVRTTKESDGVTPKAFAAGESYLITITLYGPEQIKITATLTGWSQSDTNIAVDPDAE